MPDDRLDDELRAYADHVQNVGRLPMAAEIRQTARRRTQRRSAAAAFGVVIVGALGVGLGLGRSTPTPITPPPGHSASTPAPSVPSNAVPSSPAPPSSSSDPSAAAGPPSPPATTTATSPAGPPEQTSTSKPAASGTVASDLSQLRRLGIDLDVSVLIDVADDGADYFMEVGSGGGVDFTGTGKSDATRMLLKAAQVTEKTEETNNRVVIAPPAYDGSCVADSAPGDLRLAACDDAAENQVWRVVPGGDSGQFELQGAHTVVSVEGDHLVAGSQGRIGLQTIRFDK
ncbi:hypothetical protein [Mangrovihabitans endophyticus]|uniref:Uncharacterized protein n=1 Tax=Mangrovihabitans endophyticus TaxID=1751298 RepID=A0A8J3C5V2_9ACTN|nr:hypothetical protein [Mangrovihabitans endophyticus]GGL11452.1 hypothetical protein GCM10012284_52710 [Mangrovihabitans endophyticus]